MNTDHPAPHGTDRPLSPLTRRRLLQTGGVLAAAAAAGTVAPPIALGREQPAGGKVTVENLGPGVVGYATLAGLLVGDTMYVGSRNLDPSRVVGFHVPTGRVTETFMLGNGDFVNGLAADGADVLYAGVTHAANRTNLYRCDLRTGEVTGIAAVPGLFIRDLAVAPDGVVYIVGRPRPEHGDGPPVFSYDPATGELTKLAVPEPDADQGFAVDVTDTTVYYGCDSSLTDRTGNGLFAIDRASGAVTRLRDGHIRNHGVKVLGDVLAVGGNQGVGDRWFGVLNLVDGSWREFELPAGLAVRRDDDLIVFSNRELYQIDLNTWTLTHIGTPGLSIGGRPGLLNTLVVGAARDGYVWTFDLVSGETESHLLVAAGAPGDPQLGMSVGAGDGLAYVGGTNAVAAHNLNTRSVTNLAVPGEVKDMIVVAGIAYMAVYNGQGIWEHDPAGSAEARKVADFPSGHNRPRYVAWDDVNQLLVVGMRSDSTDGGSLLLFDPATGSLTAHINPLGLRVVNAVATGHGLVYIAGNQVGDLAAWDPVEGREVWRLANPLGQDVTSLVVLGRRLFGTTTQAGFFVIDLARDPKLVHVADFSDVTSGNPRLVIDRGLIYGASARSLFRVDPVTFEPQLLVDDLGGEWFGPPRLAVDEDHWLYTLTGRDLVRIRDQSPR